MIIDKLIEEIQRKQCPVCVGLDTHLGFVPGGEKYEGDRSAAADAVLQYNKDVIDAVCDVVPSVKVQAAYYEMYGWEGMRAFAHTLEYARSRGLIAIADAKRGDIGATAQAYARAFLAEYAPFACDFLTVNAYLGSDGVAPFLKEMEGGAKGIFVLVKTSNPSSGELQDIACEGGCVYLHMAKMASQWGAPFSGRHGFSAVGAVVGATYPQQITELRKLYPSLFMLIPGFGAQGASARDVAQAFDSRGRGGVVNSSRAVLGAHQSGPHKGKTPQDAARAACLDMKAQLLDAIAFE